jgi:hypothetical protein
MGKFNPPLPHLWNLFDSVSCMNLRQQQPGKLREKGGRDKKICKLEQLADGVGPVCQATTWLGAASILQDSVWLLAHGLT